MVVCPWMWAMKRPNCGFKMIKGNGFFFFLKEAIIMATGRPAVIKGIGN